MNEEQPMTNAELMRMEMERGALARRMPGNRSRATSGLSLGSLMNDSWMAP